MKLAVIADYAEEGWPSMDLCASELLRNLPPYVAASSIQPKMNLRLTRLLGRSHSKDSIHILDRLLNRQWDYPHYASRKLATKFDAYHIVDHSYASIAHALPAERTGIYCHDLDAFRSILEPSTELRPFWFRAMSQRIMKGLMKAAVVFHNSLQTGEALRRFNIVPEARLVHAPLGIADEFGMEEKKSAGPAIRETFDLLEGRPILLHVGSNIPRKRIDVLLHVFDAVRDRIPEVILLKIGNAWSPEQSSTIMKLGIRESIVHLGKLEQSDLAACYRRADAVLITSDAEGFGLPVIEAMACGSPVVASDIPVLRETGGQAAMYAPVADIDAWVGVVSKVIMRDAAVPSQDARLAWASRFSWEEHAKIIAEAYQRLM
jgi:glycosyltransferase involved in cell wall biosynthesis